MKHLLLLTVLLLLASCGPIIDSLNAQQSVIYDLKCYSGNTLKFQYVGPNLVQTTSSGYYKVTKDGADYTISLGCILKESY